MKKCCIILRDSYPDSLDDKDKEFINEFTHRCRKLLFSTKFKDNETRQYYSFKEMIVGISDVKCCPYCGKEFISHNPFTGEKDSSGINIDYFYSSAHFPFFCLSLFNLVPCCLYCNVMKADRFYEDLESPFFDASVHHALSSSESKGLVKDYYEDVLRNSELIRQPQEVVEEYFSVTDKLPINEYKVVLLGDGGAGKTLTLSRMIHEGEYITDFNGDSTPGICIRNETIKIDNESIHVNYWDFGGQEVLHSMHRMFMTKRAVYIIFLNARYNTQDDRAKYWLHNMNYYESQDSPVVIVLNQMDQNPYALLNESGLKRLYPNLKRVIRISALNDEPDKIFNVSG